MRMTSNTASLVDQVPSIYADAAGTACHASWHLAWEELKRQPTVVDAEVVEDRNWLEPGLFEALLSTAA